MIKVITSEGKYRPDQSLISFEGDYYEYTDKFGRRWKLIPVTNENIKFPFIVEPLVSKGL